MKATIGTPSFLPAESVRVNGNASGSTDPFVLGQIARLDAGTLPLVLAVATDGEMRGRVGERLAERFEVVMTRGMKEAEECLRMQRFLLVVMDVREGGRPVDDCARELRRLDGEMSVIALGAGKAVRVIDDQCLQVPFDAADMLDIAEQQIEAANRRRSRTGVMREMEGLIAMLQTELEEKDTLAAHGEASASMVHDLKNALFSTLGYTARLIQETAQLKDSVGDRAQPIDAIAKKLEHTSNYLLHLAHTCRFNEGAAVRERLNLHDEIEHVHAVLFFHSPNLRVVRPAGVEAGDWDVMGDRYELHRVFQNLFKNAFEAGATEVVAGLRAEGGKVFVEITDNGPGFPEGQAARAFTKPLPSSKRGGQGIGLRICRQIVERHGGGISLRSSPGRGAVFTLALPAAGRA